MPISAKGVEMCEPLNDDMEMICRYITFSRATPFFHSDYKMSLCHLMEDQTFQEIVWVNGLVFLNKGHEFAAVPSYLLHLFV